MLYCFDISILKNLWTRGPVFSCHTGSHKLYSCSWTSCQATALLPPFKKSVCVCNPWKEIVSEYFPKGSILIFRTYNLLNLPASMFDVLYFILFLIKIFSSPSFRGWRENAWEKKHVNEKYFSLWITVKITRMAVINMQTQVQLAFTLLGAVWGGMGTERSWVKGSLASKNNLRKFSTFIKSIKVWLQRLSPNQLSHSQFPYLFLNLS